MHQTVSNTHRLEHTHTWTNTEIHTESKHMMPNESCWEKDHCTYHRVVVHQRPLQYPKHPISSTLYSMRVLETELVLWVCCTLEGHLISIFVGVRLPQTCNLIVQGNHTYVQGTDMKESWIFQSCLHVKRQNWIQKTCIQSSQWKKKPCPRYL